MWYEQIEQLGAAATGRQNGWVPLQLEDGTTGYRCNWTMEQLGTAPLQLDDGTTGHCCNCTTEQLNTATTGHRCNWATEQLADTMSYPFMK